MEAAGANPVGYGQALAANVRAVVPAVDAVIDAAGSGVLRDAVELAGVLLLPFQVSVLGTPSPAVTPTNLLYNALATPGALYRYRRQHQAAGRLGVLLTAGTLPGVIAGSVIRVVLLPARASSPSSWPLSCSPWAPGWLPPALPALPMLPGPPVRSPPLL